MLNEYYGCQTVKDEDAIEHLEHCFTTKEFILDFIKQIREVTGSNEPLILAPTPTKGKTQSAKMGSCHWAYCDRLLHIAYNKFFLVRV